MSESEREARPGSVEAALPASSDATCIYAQRDSVLGPVLHCLVALKGPVRPMCFFPLDGLRNAGARVTVSTQSLTFHTCNIGGAGFVIAMRAQFQSLCT